MLRQLPQNHDIHCSRSSIYLVPFNQGWQVFACGWEKNVFFHGKNRPGENSFCRQKPTNWFLLQLLSHSMSNLSFLSKLLERVVQVRLQAFLDCNDMLPVSQSAYRQFHSTCLLYTSDAADE